MTRNGGTGRALHTIGAQYMFRFKPKQVHLKVPGSLQGFGLEESRGPEGEKKKPTFQNILFYYCTKSTPNPPLLSPSPLLPSPHPHPGGTVHGTPGWGDKASAPHPAHGLRSAPGHFGYLTTPEAARLGQGGPSSHVLLGRVGLRVGAGCTVPGFALTPRTGAREQDTSQDDQSRPCPANEDGRTKLVPMGREGWGQKPCRS